MIAFALAAVVLAAYATSFRGQFVLDDYGAILENPTIRNLGDVKQVLSPPSTSALVARPVANLTLAIDYALWGGDVWGYHATNLVIHLAGALCVFGLSRRLWERFRNGATPIEAAAWAGVMAAMWALHPLQTESVTFIVMRSESLAGFFYLFTLYSSVRSMERPKAWGWTASAVLACCMGVLSKEYVVSAPLLALCLDRAAYAGSFRRALRERWPLYFGLFSAWLPLAVVISASGGGRNDTCGFGTAVTPWQYLLTQCRALVVYLRLAIWPDALCFDYGRAVVRDVSDVLPQALFLISLAALTTWGMIRNTWWGLAGFCFFAVISPSSSVVPLATQTAAEHRMYLPLLAVVALAAGAVRRWAGRKGWLAFVVPALILGFLTYERNKLYADPLALWQDTVDRQPNNARARNNLGNALMAAGRTEEALAQYEAGNEAMGGKDSGLQANRALALFELGHFPEAEWGALTSLDLDPKCVPAMAVLSAVDIRRGRLAEAREWMEKATALAPENRENLVRRGRLFWMMGDLVAAKAGWEYALTLDANNAAAHFWLGRLAYDAGNWPEAVRRYGRAAELQPTFGEAHNNLAGALAMSGDRAGALVHYEAALGLLPRLTATRFAYATMLAQGGRLSEAVAQYEIGLDEEPKNVVNRVNYGLALQLLGRLGEARTQYETALSQDPDSEAAKSLLVRLNRAGTSADAARNVSDGENK